VVPEKGGALWSTMQERLSLDTLVMNVKTELGYPLDEDVPPFRPTISECTTTSS